MPLSMNHRTLASLTLAPLALAAFSAFANEGMWMPQQLPSIAKDLKAAGFKANPASLSKLTEFPMGAIVSLGGCSASFVSPQGLVVTNHHCAYGSIQYNSTAERDLIKKGFLAQSFEEELPAAPGSRILVTEEVRDVTAQVLDASVQALSGKARTDAIEGKTKALVAECEKGGGYRCGVSSFYGGVLYQLIKQMEIRDVRLVHAPADMVGRFGGDTDNWMWPRHTGDYSFYRAYVGADGKPADFNKANKPYAPKFHLQLASKPLKEGDFVMVAGYPGSTQRLRLPQEVDFTFRVERPAMIKAFDERMAIIRKAGEGNRELEIKLASGLAGLANTHKNWTGQQASYDGSDILPRKQADYDALRKWVNADAKRQAQFGASFAEVEKLLAEGFAIREREMLLGMSTPGLLNTARSLYENAVQAALPDEKRKPGYQQRDQLRTRQALESMERRYDSEVDRRVAAHFLAQYLAQPADKLEAPLLQALGLSQGMAEPAIRARLDVLYAKTLLADKATRLSWMGKPAADFKASDDSMIAAAVALYDFDQAMETRDKERAGRMQVAYSGVMKALMAFRASKGEALYPDANGTLRVSFGKVTGRPSDDGTQWTAFTTLRGITAKHRGAGDFNAPEEQLAAIRAKQFDRYAAPELGSVPVNFLATLDTTGGNSGSAVMNDRSELVGLLFDGTLDGVIANWDFDRKNIRSICLDARYMLWQMKVVDKADRLLKEMKAL
jgi:hypothetical protein